MSVLAWSLAQKVASNILDKDCPPKTIQRLVEWFEQELRGMYGSVDIPESQEKEATEMLYELWEEANGAI